MSSGNCETSSLKVNVPEIIGVTGVSDDVETKVPNNPDELDSIKRDCFVRIGYASRGKDD